MAAPLGHWLQRAARLHRSRLAESLDDLGLFPGQEQLLIRLAEAGECTVGDLADKLDVRPPTVSKSLQRLAAQGLIERGGDEGDGRRTRVHLTAAGKVRVRDLEAVLERVEEELADALDGKDARRLRKLLRRLTRHLAGAEQAAEDDIDSGDDEDRG